MTLFKGTIALDIDGTITVHHHILEPAVKSYLESLVRTGWRLLFVTGRTFSFAEPILEGFQGAYWIAVQNGAALFEMPGERLKEKKYLSIQDIPCLDSALREEKIGLLIESGRRNQDICYYRPNDFSEEETAYLQFRMSISPEKWVRLDSFEQLPVQEFAVGKYFARKEIAQKMAQVIEQNNPNRFQIMVIRDPFRPGFHLALVSDKNATKGSCVDQMRLPALPLIVAGDDYNDLDMLKKADVKIVMGNAPDDLHALGDIVAPPASEQGIIPALEEAIHRITFKQ